MSLSLPSQSGTPGGPCYCGRPAGYTRCCRPVVERRTPAETAEDLMRSRYSAFCVDDSDYLLHSWHLDTRPPKIGGSPTTTWLGLTVVSTEGGGVDDETGTVEFIARYSDPLGEHALHELSSFVRVDGRWVYQDGDDVGSAS